MPGMKRILPLVLILLGCSAFGAVQRRAEREGDGSRAMTGSLVELKGKRRVLVLVRRSAVVDSDGTGKAILEEVFRAEAGARNARYPRIYNAIVHKLNKYMIKYQSITAARDFSDAEFIVFFNLLEYRRLLGYSYPYGELFVILNDHAAGRAPHIIWKTPKTSIWVEDAIEDLIKEMKAARGEGERRT